MTKPLTLTPILYAALGAAASYYGTAMDSPTQGLLGFLGALLISTLSLIRVLALAPPRFFQDPQVHRCFCRYRVYLIALCLGFSLGIGTGVSSPVRLGLPEENIIGIYGTLQDDPRSSAQGRGMGNLVLQRISGRGGIGVSAQGKVRVFFPDGTIPRLREFGRGSEVYIEGSFLSPRVSPGTSAGKTPAFRGQSVHIVVPAPGIEQVRTGLRLYLLERFAGQVWGGLALAILVGAQDNLDTELSRSYQYAGCSHVLALSGMHLAVLAGILSFLLKKPLGLKLAGIIGMLGILIYTYLAGNLPSLNRAAIMYVLGTLALLGTLPRQPITLLGMSFLIQIILQPESGQGIAFILSYLALGGILLIGEAIHELIPGVLPDLLFQPLAVSLGAFIATAGVVGLFFGVLRPIGILAGLLIVPLTNIFMLGAIGIIVLDLLLPLLVQPLGMILSWLYAILEKIASLSALAPGIPVSSPGLVCVVSLGLSIGIMVLRNRQKALRRTLAPFHCS